MLGNRVTNERINKIGYKQSKKLNVNVYFFAGNHPPPPPKKRQITIIQYFKNMTTLNK